MILVELKKGQIVDANHAAADFYGYPVQKLKMMNISEINIMPTAEIKEKMSNAHQRSENVFLFKHRLSNQEIRDVEVFSTPMTLGRRKVLHSIIHDVTRRLLAEEELRIKKEVLRSIISGTNLGTWEWNIQTGETTFNERWAEIIGYTLSELQPVSIQTWLHFAHPDDLQESARLLQEHFSGKAPLYKMDSRMRHKDGSWIWVYDSGKVVTWDAEGKPLLMVGTHLDITKRKEDYALLHEREERYRVLMSQSYDAIALLDLESLEIVEVNRRFEQMTGWRLPEDAPIHAYQVIEDEKENIDGYLAEVRQNGVLDPFVRRLRTKSGKRIYVERAGSLIELGGRRYQLTTFRDVTTEKLRSTEIAQDLSLASNVQLHLLPAVPVAEQFAIHTLFKPFGYVSGDVYYFKWHDVPRILRGYLADVTGHGVAAAIQTSAVNVLLHETADMPLKVSVDQQTAWLNKKIARYVSDTSFVASIAFEIDFFAQELRVAAAGIGEFIYNDRHIKVPGLYLGINEKEMFEKHVFPFQEGDSVCFMTDGIADALNRENLWGHICGKDICTLYNEDFYAGKIEDDATAIYISGGKKR